MRLLAAVAVLVVLGGCTREAEQGGGLRSGTTAAKGTGSKAPAAAEKADLAGAKAETGKSGTGTELPVADGKSTDRSEQRVSRSMAEFRPSVHGFAFVNNFTGSSLPVDLGEFERKLGLPQRYGLCGGMSAAAADYFLAHQNPPQETTPPQRGSALYTYLYSRQAASLGPLGAMALKYAEWMKLSDAEVATRTRDELPRMLEMVERGEPVVLGLVFEGAGGAAWENHQVLAYGVEPRRGAVDLKVYDPNYPKSDDVVVRIAEDGRAARVGPGNKGRDVRGVFRMPYEAAVPRVE